MHVNGYTRSLVADHLAAMSMAMVVAYILIGLLATGLARRGIAPIYLLGGGRVLSLLALMLIITQAIDQHYLLWMAFGVFSSFGTLAYSQIVRRIPGGAVGARQLDVQPDGVSRCLRPAMEDGRTHRQAPGQRPQHRDRAAQYLRRTLRFAGCRCLDIDRRSADEYKGRLTSVRFTVPITSNFFKIPLDHSS